MKFNSHLKRIQFDSTAGSNYLGIFLLIVGLITFGVGLRNNVLSLSLMNKTNQAIAVLHEKLDTKVDKKFVVEDAQSTEIYRKIKEQKEYPWEILFLTLEAEYTNKISLMAIQPNMEKKEVLISAEATNLHEMFDYVRKLSAQKTIGRVELQNHEFLADSEQQRVGFLMTVKLR